MYNGKKYNNETLRLQLKFHGTIGTTTSKVLQCFQ